MIASFVLVLIPMATLRKPLESVVPCRQALLPIYTAE